MINRLTVTPDTKYSRLTEEQKDLLERSHESASMVSAIARSIYPADNVDGVDLNPEKGKIEMAGQKDSTVMMQKMSIKDPDKKTFELRNVESFEMKAVDRSSGQFSMMALQNDAAFDADGDGKKEQGMLCTLADGIVNPYTKKPELNGRLQVFVNEGSQSVTVIEEVPSQIWTPQ
ncbi:MAG: hypothetical protein RDV48_23530 [Candidatus Eremiobacteraeota bacterium]|nr:hypothetical protein [Candidatus Eremiobacteraeota bacterium]